MTLSRLVCHQFRNLDASALQFDSGFNFIYGANGSGKSSLLEAIGYLGLGRSFRGHRHQSVVQHGQTDFTVYGEVGQEQSGEHHRLGLSRDIRNSETRLKLDGQPIRSLSELAQKFPVAVIDPGVFEITAGSPSSRRQFLDWSVFHVEHQYGMRWQRTQRLQAQRNKLLKSGRLDDAQMSIWDQQFAQSARSVAEARERIFKLFSAAFQVLVEQCGVTWLADTRLELFPGWDTSRDLEQILLAARAQELKVGHTLYGPSRADIRLKVGSRGVAETLSRGQQKTLVILFKLAQGIVLAQSGKRVTYLLDDINAELDSHHRQMLLTQLNDLKSQVFITTIERPPLAELAGLIQDSDPGVFHVEHGRFSQQ